MNDWCVSSAGRAMDCLSVGQEFESPTHRQTNRESASVDSALSRRGDGSVTHTVYQYDRSLEDRPLSSKEVNAGSIPAGPAKRCRQARV